MEVFKILVWPLAVIIIVLIIVLLLKKSIMDILSRVTKLKYGDTIAEVSQSLQDKTEKSLLGQSQSDRPNENIEKALGLFSQPTLDRAKKLVEDESKINEISDINFKVEALVKYSEALYLILSFERIYNLIFGSQLYILDYVNTDRSQAKNDLKTFYDAAKDKYPDFYSAYSYDDYFDFLVAHELVIIKSNDCCEITWLGRDFLKYLVETAKTINKKY